jgi:hypothetical protein
VSAVFAAFSTQVLARDLVHPDASEALARQIRVAVERILAALSDDAVRKFFESAEPAHESTGRGA